uniref:G-patch domain-containing protein n=1 Tax=Timema bartmani TaxID=61472 RepID=A0A7R9F5D7_9NEOP|nr:unnamed protein product [Timema bartmani]
MSASDNEEHLGVYGTPLEPLDEDALPRKKPFSLADQVVKDKQGRQRFHGAFTGGFSAGFFNSVGSLEGWAPATFKSSRSERAAKNNTPRPEDFMDEEDMEEFGIAPRVLRAQRDYTERGGKRERGVVPEGPIPGEPVLRHLLQPVRETVGVRLLRKMGWKPGQGVGPRVSKGEKQRIRQENERILGRVYGCSSEPQQARGVCALTAPQSSNGDTSSDEDISELTFAPDDYEVLVCRPKDNSWGLGYTGLDHRPILSAHIDLFSPSAFIMKDKGKKVSISGQAFGVGALEEDDEDIYSHEDMSQYDFSLDSGGGSGPSMVLSRPRHEAGVLEGFIKSSRPVSLKKHFPPPVLPQQEQPQHQAHKSRFEPAPESTDGATMDRKRGLQRHTLSANDRATILGEAPQPDEEKKLAEGAARLTEGLAKTVPSGRFKPFLAQPDKQRRYEHFLVLGVAEQKDGLSRLQPANMTEWEREREHGEFEQAARLYKPLSAAMSERFVSATHPDSTDPLVEVEKTTSIEDADLRAAARLKMFGRLTRIKTEIMAEDLQGIIVECLLTFEDLQGIMAEDLQGITVEDLQGITIECPQGITAEELHGIIVKGLWEIAIEGLQAITVGLSRGSFLSVARGSLLRISRELLSSGAPPRTQRKSTNFAVFDFLDTTPPHDQDTDVRGTLQESSLTISGPSVTPLDADTEHRVPALEETPEDTSQLIKFEDPPQKIDLYKAIFLSSSDSELQSEDEIDPSNKTSTPIVTVLISSNTQTQVTDMVNKVVPLSVPSQPSKNKLRNTSPPRGLFANLDMDIINACSSPPTLDETPILDTNTVAPSCSSSVGANDASDVDVYGPSLPSSLMTPRSLVRPSVSLVSRPLASVCVANVTVEKERWVEKCNMLLTYLGQADPMLHRYLYLFKITQLFEFLEQVVKDFIKNQPPNIPPVKQKPEDDGPEVSTDSGVFVFSMLAQLLTGEILGLEREECTEPIVNEIPVIIPVPSLNNPLPLTIQQMLLLTPLDQYSNNFTTSSNNKPSTESNENTSMSNTAKSELEAFYSGNRHQPVMNYAPLNNQVLMYQPIRCALENQEISSLYAVGQEEIMDMCTSSMRNGIVSPLVQRIASSKNIYKYSSAKKRGRKLAKKLNFIQTASPKYNI